MVCNRDLVRSFEKGRRDNLTLMLACEFFDGGDGRNGWEAGSWKNLVVLWGRIDGVGEGRYLRLNEWMGAGRGVGYDCRNGMGGLGVGRIRLRCGRGLMEEGQLQL